jgi:hypothetical protein
MDVAGQFERVCVFLTKNEFISVLKKVPVAAVTTIKCHGIAGK